MSFIVHREYARAKSKPINELQNLPPDEVVRFCRSRQRFMKKIQTSNFTNHSVYISDDEITKRIWTAYFVHWCDLLHRGNDILPSTENYSFNPHISIWPRGPREMRVSGVILALDNMTLPQCNKSHHYTLQQSIFVY